MSNKITETTKTVKCSVCKRELNAVDGISTPFHYPDPAHKETGYCEGSNTPPIRGFENSFPHGKEKP